MSRRPMTMKTLYIMIRGFLGAGKTTGVVQLAQHPDTQSAVESNVA